MVTGAVFAVFAMLATILTLAPSVRPVSAQTAIEHSCVVEPAATPAGLIQAGVQAAVPGEVVSFVHEVTLPAGTAFQQLIERADGSTVFGSAIETTALASNLVVDTDSIVFTIDGVATTLVDGTTPVANDWVLVTEGATTWTVLFPGDPSTGDPETGVPSVIAPDEASVLRFSFDATVAVDAAPGSVETGAQCYASLSTGSSSQETDRISAAVSVVRPIVEAEIAADAPGEILVPGSVVTFELTVSVPQYDPADPTLAVAPARDAMVVSTIPPEYEPVDEFGFPLTDGATSPSGGVWDAVARTLTFDAGDIEPGTSITIPLDVQVDPTLPPDTVVGKGFEVQANYLTDGGGAPVTSPAVSTIDLRTASGPPTITKSAPVENFDRVRELTYTITVEIPADSTYQNFVVSDDLPPNALFRRWVSETCVDALGAACPGFSASRINPQAQVDGSQLFGWNIGEVPLHPEARTMTFQVNTDIRPVDRNWGEQFLNTATANWNAIDQFGAANPDPRAWPVWDGSVSADETVTYNRPVLETTYTSDQQGPWDFDPADPDVLYTMTITNTGSLPAVNSALLINQNNRIAYDLSTLNITGATCVDCALDGNNYLRGTLSDIAVGDTVTITVIGRPTNTGTGISSSQVSSYVDPEGTTYGGTPYGTVSWLIEDPGLEVTKTGDEVIGVLIGTPITFNFSVRNVSAQTALIPRVIETLPTFLCPQQGDTIAIDLATAAGYEFAATLAPGASQSFSATFEVCGAVTADTYTNTATARWNDIGDDRDQANQFYGHVDTHDFEVQVPVIEVTKTPEVGAPGVVDQTDPLGGAVRTGEWEVTVTNTSDVDAYDLAVSDPLPDGMEYELGTAVAAWSGAAYTLVDNSASDPAAVNPGGLSPNPATTVDLVIERLDPGESVTITIPFSQNSVLPEPQTQINTVTVTGGNLPADAAHTADGEYETLPLEPGVRITKTASPDAGARGQSVTYTLDVFLQGSLYDIRDIVIRDIVPDGMTVTNLPAANDASPGWATWTASCVSGDCAEVEFTDVIFLGNRTEGDPGAIFDVDQGETELQFYIGDFVNPLSSLDPGVIATADTVIRITYTTQVDDTFANGDPVINGAEDEPLKNVAKAHFNRDEERGGSASGNQVTGAATAMIDPTTDRDRSGPRAEELFDVAGPIIDFTKAADVGGTNVTVSGLPYSILGDISLVDVGDTITYTVTVTNAGDTPAFDLVFTDNLGNGALALDALSVSAVPGPGSSGASCVGDGLDPETLTCTMVVR